MWLAGASLTGMRTKALPVRIPLEMVARIDKLRGLVPRETYIREHLLEQAIQREERKAGK